MSTYTVIQDIEAEDKLLGPLTLRQFIYAGIMIGCLFFAFLAGKVSIFLGLPFILPAAIFGFLAAPWSKDQPTETWAVAKVRFLFIPRKRIWNQTGQKDLVKITVPKRDNIQYTDGLSRSAVQHRLQALASTIDTRGWAVKNSPGGGGGPSQQIVFTSDNSSDRLTGSPSMPQAVSDYAVAAPNDVLDEQTGVAKQFDQMIATAEQVHRQKIMQKLNNTDPSPDSEPTAPSTATDQSKTWFTPQSQGNQAAVQQIGSMEDASPESPAANSPTVSPEEEEKLLTVLEERDNTSNEVNQNHLKVIQPLGAAPAPAATKAATADPVDKPNTNTDNVPAVDSSQVAQNTNKTEANNSANAPVTAAPDPAILNLSRNDDLDVATIARQAKKKSDNEVVISLH